MAQKGRRIRIEIIYWALIAVVLFLAGLQFVLRSKEETKIVATGLELFTIVCTFMLIVTSVYQHGFNEGINKNENKEKN